MSRPFPRHLSGQSGWRHPAPSDAELAEQGRRDFHAGEPRPALYARAKGWDEARASFDPITLLRSALVEAREDILRLHHPSPCGISRRVIAKIDAALRETA